MSFSRPYQTRWGKQERSASELMKILCLLWKLMMAANGKYTACQRERNFMSAADLYTPPSLAVTLHCALHNIHFHVRTLLNSAMVLYCSNNSTHTRSLRTQTVSFAWRTLGSQLIIIMRRSLVNSPCVFHWSVVAQMDEILHPQKLFLFSVSFTQEILNIIISSLSFSRPQWICVVSPQRIVSGFASKFIFRLTR